MRVSGERVKAVVLIERAKEQARAIQARTHSVLQPTPSLQTKRGLCLPNGEARIKSHSRTEA